MRLAVRGAWIADNLRRLGSGAIYHLAYPTHQIDSSRTRTFTAGHVDPREGRHLCGPRRPRRASRRRGDRRGALVSQLIRIHFMIGKVYVDEIGEVIDWSDSDYLVRGGGPTTILV